ncbi:hypothetical protein N8912_00495, partial [Rhodobacteraceae bacterium]|nr:hypothetical protein [Paracoccaceae bacterium]
QGLALTLFGDCFDIDPIFPAWRRIHSLRTLYCCFDCLRGRGTAVTYLSHNAAFHSKKQIAPSNQGNKKLNEEPWCTTCR